MEYKSQTTAAAFIAKMIVNNLSMMLSVRCESAFVPCSGRVQSAESAVNDFLLCLGHSDGHALDEDKNPASVTEATEASGRSENKQDK